MSMLAEARRKQKWSLNPRGKQWSADSNKFGQKMLEKMGWSSGKGLGKNEQGTTEHVRVSLKNDMGGIGFKEDTLDQAWTEHQDSFNDFLQKLQQDSSSGIVRIEESRGELSGKSLELKSKQSRARVHYTKFTRGKDVNKYSSKDLANIFGQKELNVVKDGKSKPYNGQENSDPIGSQDNRGGVLTINSGNMADYFKEKGQNFSIVCPKEKHQENTSESEPEYAGFGFASTFEKTESSRIGENKKTRNVCNYAFENPCVELNSPENSPSSASEFQSSTKRKLVDDNKLCMPDKAKKFKEGNIIEDGCKNGIANAGLNLECQADDACNGKEFEISRVQFGLTNTALDLSDEAEDKKRVRFNDHVEYSTDSAKCKKGTFMLDKFEVENKKTKKKKKYSDHDSDNSITCGFVNEALDVEAASEEVHDNEVNERKSKKGKKRKAGHRSNLETIVEMPEENKDIYEEDSKIKRIKMEVGTVADSLLRETVKSKKKKKERKEKIEVVEREGRIDELVENEVILRRDTVEEGCEAGEDEANISKKKKKKKKNKSEDKNARLNLEEGENNVSENKMEVEEGEAIEVEFMHIKKRKKSKNEGDTNDINTKEINGKNAREGCSEKENKCALEEIETPKKKKHRKPVDESSVSNNSVQSIECAEKSLEEVNTTMSNGSLESTNKGRFNNTSSPWNPKSKMPKRLLRTLFQRNSIQNFPGSNVYEIKGYGVDVQ